MRHFGTLSAAQQDALFAQLPKPFDAASDRRTLSVALGATLYTPGTRADYADRLPGLLRTGLTSSVLCLEDAIADGDVGSAERNVITQLTRAHAAGAEVPLIFVRVRHPDQVRFVAKELGDAAPVLAGFVFPKFTTATGSDYLEALAEARAATGLPLYGMPVLEGTSVLYAESRVAELIGVRELLTEYSESVLAVRIGATDLCGLYGLRRGPDLTVYHVAVIRDVIADIVNVLLRDDAFTVTGPVWEHYASAERLLRPQLRTSPFARRDDLPHAPSVREALVDRGLDALLHEVVLDKATGIVGKTVIHPMHIRPVHALYAVTAEEYADALDTLALPTGGVAGSAYANRMLEGKPHARWAAATLRRADVFGVLREERTFVDLLDLEDVGA